MLLGPSLRDMCSCLASNKAMKAKINTAQKFGANKVNTSLLLNNEAEESCTEEVMVRMLVTVVIKIILTSKI